MKKIGWLTVPALIILLTFTFFYFKNQKSQNNLIQPPNPQAKEATSSPNLEKIFHIQISNKKLQSSETIQVKVGDNVTFTVMSDEAEELHLHGYDKSVNLEKGKEVQLKFKADISGRFPYELEKSKTDLGILEVLP